MVSTTKHGPVAVITIDNPPVNALSPGVPEGIVAEIAAANLDPEVQAIVVIGAGRTFIVRPPQVIDTSEAGRYLARLAPPERAYCRLAEKLAILELAEQLPGFGPRLVSGPG